MRDRIQPGALRRRLPVLGDVGRVHDLGKADQRRVARKVEVLDQNVERALAVPVRVLRPWRVIGMSTITLCDAEDLVAGYEQELRVRVDEPPDQPGARDPVALGVLPCYPLHVISSFASLAACVTGWCGWLSLYDRFGRDCGGPVRCPA